MDKQPCIDRYLCVRCGQCVASCPMGLFQRKQATEYPTVVDHAENACIACNHCVSVCPVGAVSVGNIGADDCQVFAKESVPRFDHIATLARMRRSIRRYSDKPVEDRIIVQMLDVVRWAPSAKNGLPVKWVVINNREKLLELGAIALQWLEKQPGGEVLRAAWNAGEDPIFRGAPCLVAAYTESTAIWPQVDTAIAVETLDLCVTAMRLGSCWAGFFIRAAQNDPEINAWLGLTTTQQVHGGLMLGHIGDEVFQKIPYRPELDLRWIH